MHTATNRLEQLTPAQRERFWTKVDKSGGDEACWIWTGSLHERGYGMWSIGTPSGGSTSVRPHRVSWYLINGMIPDGLVVDHLCMERACVNPAHLSVVDQGVNSSRVPATAAVAPMARFVSALIQTRTDAELRQWWETWLNSTDYMRRAQERAAIADAR